MTDSQMDAPERIWAWTYKMGEGELGAWDVDPEEAPPNASRYILATPTVLAADPAVKALVAEAVAAERERCAQAGGDKAVEILMRHEPDAGLLKIQMTRQAIAAAIRKGETP